MEGDVPWNAAAGQLDASALGSLDACINLSGENLALRWSPERKKAFRESRLQTTTLIARTLAALPKKPAVFISASAIGIYGADRGDELLDESSTLGTDFLAALCRDWEAATAVAADAGIRVVNTRFGFILNPNGGVLAKLLLPFRLGAGGKFGAGDQWSSWISLSDHISAIHFLLERSDLRGPVNLTAPNPVTNEELAMVLGTVLHRPSVMPVPAPIIRMMLGKEMADQTVLASQRVLPKRLIEAGFEFEFPLLRDALQHELSLPA
jgi:hypothetical protein